MRILFDNNVPDPLRRFLSGHVVRTAEQLQWARLRNGDLLRAAEAASFDLIITADQNITYQQNLASRTIALIVLGSNQWALVRQQLSEIVAAADQARPQSYAFVEIPLPPRAESNRR